MFIVTYTQLPIIPVAPPLLCWESGPRSHRKFRTRIKGAEEALTAAGVHVVYVESTGTAHEWQTWRRALYDFAPRLFR